MEHPIFFLPKAFEMVGLGHFAHLHLQIIHSWLVIIIMVLSAIIFTRGIKLMPTKAQNAIEIIIDGLENFLVDVGGPESRMFFPFIATIFFYILLCNLIGLIPGFYSPTADINTTLALALCTFVYTHVIGIRYHGIKYIKHFMGPVWWLTPLMIPIEIMSHIARVLSLSLRLFGNIFAKETILGILFLLAGLYLAPLPILFMGVLVSLIQALVFMILSIIYFAGAMEEAH
ncbi:MAG TPA: F0F1 ATP synthase subunit A [Desulfobacteraceae bacterium]|nr:F0F1 ATP synthase subunit A [Desulfobacteraceae bacterium]HPJ66435.1 F0F1 ATP synthase subunit A [Desulfobacteraceae bacterium]